MLPNEKASVGSSGCGARRSIDMVSTRAAMAPASSRSLAGMPGAIAISDMAAIATQISSTRRPGTRALAPLVAVSGRARSATPPG